MITVFRKSTVRPLPLVKRPLIKDLEEDVEHVGVRLFDFVKKQHGIRAAAHLPR